MKPIKAVIWDLGGVLVRTEDTAPRRALAARYGLSSKDVEHLVFTSEMGQLAQLGRISTAQLWEFVLSELSIPLAESERVQAEFWRGDRLDKALVERIRGLHPGLKTALLSNAWSDLREVLEQRWEILDAFDAVVISAEVGVVKPDPRIYRLVLEQLGLEPEEAIFLDDFSQNVAAAKALGMQAIHFRNPEQAFAEIAALRPDL